MPCILKVRVEAARDLPAVSELPDSVDAYVEVKFFDHDIQRTEVCRKTRNPTWNEDFRFEITDDAVLQDEPIEFTLFDYDAVSKDYSVGSVSIDLNPLLGPDAP